jgi:hypothetical protein
MISEEARLEEEGSQNLKRDHWADRWSRQLSEPGKGKSKFERQYDASDDADSERHGEDSEPEAIYLQIEWILGL